jgi:N-acetylglucosaminyldiphosphoundecaprenol N-acetyl-beta-D-mannosaminyltransferase
MKDPLPAPSHRVAGIPFVAAAPVQAAQSVIDDAHSARDDVSLTGPPRAVHLLNAYSLSLASVDDDYRKVLLSESSLNFPDGKPVSWISKLHGHANPLQQVRGPQFFLDAFELGQKSGVKHYLLGSTEETLQKLEMRLREKFPEANIVGSMSPPFREMTPSERDHLYNEINRLDADIVWVGLGTPKQDYEVNRLVQECGRTAVAVGAAFDFSAGTKREAPAWMTRIGIEWIFRLVSEPRRLWKRYLIGNTQFLKAALTYWRTDREDSTGPNAYNSTVPPRYVCWVREHGRSEDVSLTLDFNLVYIYPEPLKARSGILGRYVASMFHTWRLGGGPSEFSAIMTPPPFALWVRRPKKRLIVDMHSGLITDARWKPTLGITLGLLRRSDIVLGHNEIDVEYLRSRTNCEVVLLQDPVLTAHFIREQRGIEDSSQAAARAANRIQASDSRRTAIFPASGDSDEPLERVADAISTCCHYADVDFTITGKAAASRIDRPGVKTPGFLSKADYWANLYHADIVIAISTRANILQRAAFEALLAGSRPVVSESIPLRRIFGDFAEYVDPLDVRSIAAGIDRALDRGRPGADELGQRRELIRAEENVQLSQAREAIYGN